MIVVISTKQGRLYYISTALGKMVQCDTSSRAVETVLSISIPDIDPSDGENDNID